jgi:DNA-binding MarR family transcriptional regulator
MKHIEKTYPKTPGPCHCINIRRASHAVTQFYERVLRPSGLTVAQLALLRHLQLAEQPSMSELAKLVRIDRTTLNRNIKPLTDAGLIIVNAGKDSRTRQIELTKAGQEAVDRALALWSEAQESLAEYLGERDLAKLVQLLAKLEALVP